MSPPRPLDRVRRAIADDAAWWQLPLSVVLIGGLGLLLLLWSQDRTEFIYALF